MTFEGGECLILMNMRRTKLYTCDAKTENARNSNDKLLRGTSSRRLKDERVNLVDL